MLLHYCCISHLMKIKRESGYATVVITGVALVYSGRTEVKTRGRSGTIRSFRLFARYQLSLHRCWWFQFSLVLSEKQ